MHSPDLVSQTYNLINWLYTIAVLSNEPVNILSPSALKCKETISPVWALKVATSLPVSTSHNLAV